MNEQRLIDLESKYSHHDLTLEELRQIVHVQHITIEKLEKTLKLLVEQVRIGGKEIDAGHEKPPHY